LSIQRWNSVQNIPIGVPYDSKNGFLFRPFTDFTRIGILNTILVIVALFWIKPHFSEDKKKRIKKKFLLENVWKVTIQIQKPSTIRTWRLYQIAPLWGFQIHLVLFSCRFSLNQSRLLSNVSFPPLIQLIIFWFLRVGTYSQRKSYIFRCNRIGRHQKITSDGILSEDFILASLSAAILGGTSLLLHNRFQVHLKIK
jgi:hypothetical protein